MSEYTEQAAQFMATTGTTMDCVKLGTFPYFDGVDDMRYGMSTDKINPPHCGYATVSVMLKQKGF